MGDSRRNFDELLGDALDGRLTPSDRERFRVLLAQSEEDRGTFDSLRDLREKLLTVGTDGAPAGLAASIAKRIREGEASGPSETNGDPSGSRPVGWWSHFPAMGWVRVAAVFVVLALVATILVDERRKNVSPQDGVREGARVVAEDDENAKERLQADGKAEGELGEGEPGEAPARKAEEDAPESEAPAASMRGVDEPKTPPDARRDSADAKSGSQTERGDPPSLATGLDRLGKVLGVRTDADPHSFARSSGGVDVVDELAFHLTRNLRDFSREELKSPGILAWAEDQDQRFKDRGVFAGASPAPAAPRGRGRAPRPAGPGAGPGRAPSEIKGPPSGGLASVVPPVSREARFFYSLSGAGARDGVYRTLQAFGAAKELPVREAFRGAPNKAPKPRGEKAQPEGYAIFEIELPKDRADAVVAALEGLENTTLRTLGRSLLESNGIPAPPRAGGGEVSRETTTSLEDLERKKADLARRAPQPEVCTLVIMVLER